jgi:hypothetical protein
MASRQCPFCHQNQLHTLIEAVLARLAPKCLVECKLARLSARDVVVTPAGGAVGGGQQILDDEGGG